MKNKSFIGFLMAIATIILLNSYPCVTTDPIKVSWDIPQGVTYTGYEIKLVQLARTTVTEYNFTSATTNITIQKPHSGFFDVWVRPMLGTTPSEWAKSSVEGTPNPWHVFFDIAAPGGGGVQ